MSKRSKASERVAHKERWQQSGQSKKAYCEQVGIKYGTFISWFKSERPDDLNGGFIALPVDESVDYSLEILLPNGIRLLTKQPLTSGLLKNLYDV